MASLKSSTLVAYLEHMVLVKFSKEYKKWVLQRWHSLLALLPVENETSEGITEVDTETLENPYMPIPLSRYWMLKNRYR